MTTTTLSILPRQEGAVRWLTLNRPEKRNALSLSAVKELAAALDAARDDVLTRVIVLTGSGRAFCAGADLDEIRSLRTAEEACAYARAGLALMDKVENLGKPVLASINGYALGGGLELALSCSLRITSSEAVLGLPEVTHGIIPCWGGTQRLSRLCGLARAMYVCLLAERLAADQALEMGIIDRVATPDELYAETRLIAERLCAMSPFALQAAQAALREGSGQHLESGLRIETARFVSCFPLVHREV